MDAKPSLLALTPVVRSTPVPMQPITWYRPSHSCATCCDMQQMFTHYLTMSLQLVEDRQSQQLWHGTAAGVQLRHGTAAGVQLRHGTAAGVQLRHGTAAAVQRLCEAQRASSRCSWSPSRSACVHPQPHRTGHPAENRVSGHYMVLYQKQYC